MSTEMTAASAPAARLWALTKRVIDPTVLLIVAVIVAINIVLNVTISLIIDGRIMGNQDYIFFFWATFAIASFVSAIIFVSTNLGLWLAAGLRRVDVARTVLLAAVFYATAFTVIVVGVIAFSAWSKTGRIDGWMPGEVGNTLPLSWLTVAVIFATLLLVCLGGALVGGGFLRWHWLGGLAWLVVALLVPLGLVISGYVLTLTNAAGVGPASTSSWMTHATWALGLAAVAIVAQATYLPRHLAHVSAPRPSAS